MKDAKTVLQERGLPDLLSNAKSKDDFIKRQGEIRDLLQNELYGIIPPKPDHMSVEVVKEEYFARGTAIKRMLKMTFEMNGETFSFPALSFIPRAQNKLPAFVSICFFSEDQNKYTPTEEILDNGFALFSFNYKDVSSDDNDFKNGIAKNLVKSRRKANASGKISIWAWAAMRMMDYVETLPEIDADNVAVIGHSRLGKTALLAGGFDTRFKYVISNDSGCAGAAVERGKCGETYKVITDVFPFWFCPDFISKAAEDRDFPFDQHFLTALTVPRTLIIGSAALDQWADPESEFLSALAVSDAYRLFGMEGLVHNGDVPVSKCVLDGGEACYYLREGAHYFSRHDWNTYCGIIKRKIGR